MEMTRLTNEAVYSPYCQTNQNLPQGRTASDVKLMQIEIEAVNKRTRTSSSFPFSAAK